MLGRLLRLGLQAYALGIAYEFDPYFGLSISRVDPLPHQLEAVYDYLLKLARVRFLLADDAGAGKTIMSGLLVRELALRGLAERILIVCPANLAFQWQREMKEKFDTTFLVMKGQDLREQFGVNQWLEELKRDAQISPRPPVVLGGLLVVPQGLVDKMVGRPEPSVVRPDDTLVVAARARDIVMETERGLGFEPTDRELDKLGYDIESRDPATGKLRFIEVKGRRSDADTVTVTKNEILYSLNKPDDFILALVLFGSGGGDTPRVRYVRRPFQREPDFGAASVNYALKDLLATAEDPRQGRVAVGAPERP